MQKKQLWTFIFNITYQVLHMAQDLLDLNVIKRPAYSSACYLLPGHMIFQRKDLCDIYIPVKYDFMY